MSEARTTPFDIIGGRAPVEAIVNRFYDLVDGDPAYAELRAMHAPDLGPVRASLAGYLVAWMGGPRDWFETAPNTCIMSLHGGYQISTDVAGQWAGAMSRAIAAEPGLDPKFAAAMNEAIARMAHGMINAG